MTRFPDNYFPTREVRRVRQTGTLVALEDTEAPGAVCDPEGGRWALICQGTDADPHNGVCNFETLATARSFIPLPREWCPDCQKNANLEAERF